MYSQLCIKKIGKERREIMKIGKRKIEKKIKREKRKSALPI